MRVLWMTNVPLPEASKLMNEKPFAFGGWLVNLASQISVQDGMDLSVAFPSNRVSGFRRCRGEAITYFAFEPVQDNDQRIIKDNPTFRTILREVKPDIVHVFGTELAHTLSMVNTCISEGITVALSIQGLVSVIERHVYSNLPINAVYGVTLRNILKRDNVSGLRRLYSRRGRNEIEAVTKVKYVIGRTTWDRACVSQINPNAVYYSCNETLREAFYHSAWEVGDCEKHSIFLSQGHHPIKGLHFVLESLPLVLARFPDTRLYVSGKDITKSRTFVDRLSMTYYARYIIGLIRKYRLEKSIVFTGILDEEQICQRYLDSHVFVSASTIENECNSLSEAKLLGVPCVVSFVGGVTDRVEHSIDGFAYQHDAPYMLAHYICEVFASDQTAARLSQNARARAMILHDEATNTSKMMGIYAQILG